MNSKMGHMAVQTEVTFQNIRYVSDLDQHMKKNAKTGVEKLRFRAMCAVHIVMKKSDLNHMGGI